LTDAALLDIRQAVGLALRSSYRNGAGVSVTARLSLQTLPSDAE